jgi:hypothetical protein
VWLDFASLSNHPASYFLQIVGRKGDADGPDVPRVHLGACNSRYRLAYNRHLNDLAESITRNVGNPFDDVKESGIKGLETASKNLRCIARESAWP